MAHEAGRAVEERHVDVELGRIELKSAQAIETSPESGLWSGLIISRPSSAVPKSDEARNRSIENVCQSFSGTSPGRQWRTRMVPVSSPSIGRVEERRVGPVVLFVVDVRA